MRLSSLLVIASIALSGCGPAPFPGGAASPDARAEHGDAPEGAPEEAPSEPGAAETEGAPNPIAVSLNPTGRDETNSRQEMQTLAAGVTLSALGAVSAGMGGFLIGFSTGACSGQSTGCTERVALPIAGVLAIAGGAIPLTLGVLLWAPRVLPGSYSATPSSGAPMTPQTSAVPEVLIGPAAASVRWRF